MKKKYFIILAGAAVLLPVAVAATIAIASDSGKALSRPDLVTYTPLAALLASLRTHPPEPSTGTTTALFTR